jgi:glucose-1-phosphate thymidylyltransferase
VERIVDTFSRVLPRSLDEGVFVLGPDFGEEVRRQLTAICDRHGMKAYFTVQEKALGTAHAVYCARDYMDGEGIIAYADTVFDMEPGVNLEGADVVAMVKFVEDPSRFGVAVREGDRITAFVEKPAELISNEALIGVYYLKEMAVLRAEIESLIKENVIKNGEYYLTDAFDRLLNAGRVFKTASVTEWLDCGTISALMDTTRVILSKEKDLHLGEIVGSVIHDPVYVGPGARVIDAVVGPNVSIEAGATVSGSIIRDSIIFANAYVENAILANSMIGQHAQFNDQPRVVNIGDHATLGMAKTA